MTLVSMRDMLLKAKAERRAIGQFNINGLEFTQAFLKAAQIEQSPIILAASDRLVDYLGGFRTVSSLVRNLVQDMEITVPICLHLDHGMSVERCKKAVDAGFTSVMIDGSHYSIDENVAMTKEVVDYARPRQVSVEAEVGTVGGVEDGLVGGIKYANPRDCLQIIQETKIDALAVALGSVHGPYHGEPKLGFKEMEEISKLANIPLVLHGASGLSDGQIQKAINLGHAKINVNTENIQAWATAVRNVLTHNENVYEPQAIISPAREAVIKATRKKIKLFQKN